jgi:hypothetical protein
VVLRDVATFGRRGDRRLWKEWCRTMHGKNSLVWSKGLKAILLDDPNGYQQDAEIAAEADAPRDGVEVARIPGPAWDRIAHDPAAVSAILAAAATGEVDAVVSIALATGREPTARQREHFEALQRHESIQGAGRWLAHMRDLGVRSEDPIGDRDLDWRLDRLAGTTAWRHFRSRWSPGLGRVVFIRKGDEKYAAM